MQNRRVSAPSFGNQLQLQWLPAEGGGRCLGTDLRWEAELRIRNQLKMVTLHFIRCNTSHLFRLPGAAGRGWYGPILPLQLCLCGFEQTHSKQSGSRSSYSLIARGQKSKQKAHLGAACGRDSCIQAIVSWVKSFAPFK